jgi:putative transposase
MKAGCIDTGRFLHFRALARDVRSQPRRFISGRCERFWFTLRGLCKPPCTTVNTKGTILSMAYKTLEFNWLPQSKVQWQTFTLSRQEAARLWNDMVKRHYRIRRMTWTWPSKQRWEQWAARRFPNLHSQSVQQLIKEFLEAIHATRQLRKNGHAEANYAWKLFHYRDIIYTNQAARLVEDQQGRLLILPNGKSGRLLVRVPKAVQFPGRLIEVRLAYGRIMVVCEVPDEIHLARTTIGVDLGVNTLIAATDGEKAVLVSGREAKATVQWRNKKLASLVSKQSKHQRGSRRHKRLQRRKYKLLDKSHRRIKDIIHKATRIVRDVFPHTAVYVGKPFNSAAQKIGRITAQQVSSASNAKIIQQLDYKTSGAIQVSEHYSSQTCPVCGERQKCRRTYSCKCGYTAPRDVVGAVNILSIGKHGSIIQAQPTPTQIKYRRPDRRSSGGHPARSSKV